jgi:hypothetical protein
MAVVFTLPSDELGVTTVTTELPAEFRFVRTTTCL